MSRPLLLLLVALPLASLSCRGRLESDGEPAAPAASIAAPAANPHFIGSEPFPQRSPGRLARPLPTAPPPPTALPSDDL